MMTLPGTRVCASFTYSYAYSSTIICVVLYVPRTGMVFTAEINPNTCNYCCCFAATAANAHDGALYWCCSILTAADAAPGAPAAAPYC